MGGFDARKLGLILLAGLAFGSTTSVTRLGVAEIHPVTLVALRFGVTTLAFVVTLRLLRIGLPRERQTRIDIALVGFTQGFQVLAFTLALQYISSGVLAIFVAMIPLFTAVIVYFWLSSEQLALTKWLGLIIAFAGVLWLILTRTSGLGGPSTGREWQGHLLALAGAVVSAGGIVYARRALRAVEAVVVTAGQMPTALLLTAPFALVLNNTNLAVVTWRGWFALVYSAMIGSYLGFLLLFIMVRRYGATISVLPSYVMPPVSATIGAFLLGEVITLPLVVGAVLILVGLLFASQESPASHIARPPPEMTTERRSPSPPSG